MCGKSIKKIKAPFWRVVVSGKKRGLDQERAQKDPRGRYKSTPFIPTLTNITLLFINFTNTFKEINVLQLIIADCLHQKHLEEQIAKADREYEEYVSEDFLENIREIGDKYKKKAALLKASSDE